MSPFRKRDCVSALGSICFHILLSYYGLIGLLTALFASFCCWHLSAIPLLSGNCKVSQVYNQYLDSSPFFQTPAMPCRSRANERLMLAATYMRVSPIALSVLTTLN